VPGYVRTVPSGTKNRRTILNSPYLVPFWSDVYVLLYWVLGFLKHLTCPQFSRVPNFRAFWPDPNFAPRPQIGAVLVVNFGVAAELLGAAFVGVCYPGMTAFTSDGQSSIIRTGTGTNTIDGLADMIRNDGIDAKKSLLT
jgi:hypothetical protein